MCFRSGYEDDIYRRYSSNAGASSARLLTRSLTSYGLLLLLLDGFVSIFLIFLFNGPFSATCSVAKDGRRAYGCGLLGAIYVNTQYIGCCGTFLYAILCEGVISAYAYAYSCLRTLEGLRIVRFYASCGSYVTLLRVFTFLVFFVGWSRAFFYGKVRTVVLGRCTFSSSGFFVGTADTSAPSFNVTL